MFLEPAANDLDLEISASSSLNWIRAIEILRTSFLEIHPSVLEEAKKYLPDMSSVEQQLIFNGGRGVLKSENTKKLLKYARIADKKTILILSTFNKYTYWTQLTKKILNITANDININFGADPNNKYKGAPSEATYSRCPMPGYRVYITDINGLNRMVSSDFFNGTIFGNKIDLMIVDKFFQTLLMLPKSITKEVYPMVFVDDVYFSKNFDSVQCFEHIAWTQEQRLAIKEISKLFEQTFSIDIAEAIKVIKGVDFILE